MSTDLQTSGLASAFSPRYAVARQNFLAAAQGVTRHVEHHELPELKGREGEALAIDVALLACGCPDAPLVLVSSGVHGVEGLCGSGCQVVMLRDQAMLERVARSGVDLLFVHAVNPHGYSHLRRVNEGNVDLNRNFLDFDQPAVELNPRYGELHPLLLPATWPPEAENERALSALQDQLGVAAWRQIVTAGQRSHADGLFYAGAQPTWSNRVVRSILRQHATGRRAMAWVDLHTGLGPWGHGEKIHSSVPVDESLALGRATWGADVVAAWRGASASAQVRGFLAMSAVEECANTPLRSVALEFGTVPYDRFIDAVRGDHWLQQNPDAAPALAASIRQDMLEAFYQDNDIWRGMVAGQSRVAVLQACLALAE